MKLTNTFIRQRACHEKHKALQHSLRHQADRMWRFRWKSILHLLLAAIASRVYELPSCRGTVRAGTVYPLNHTDETPDGAVFKGHDGLALPAPPFPQENFKDGV